MSKTIPVETSFAERLSDPEYMSRPTTRWKTEFSLAAAVIEGRAQSEEARRRMG